MLKQTLKLVFVVVSLTSTTIAAERFTGPWNMAELTPVPEAEFGLESAGVQEVYYENVPYKGKPTSIFAYLAKPAEGAGPWPAMLCVHGGGGKAFNEWARIWAKCGYVVLAMDLAGKGPDGKPHAEAGPDQDDNGKFGEFTPDTVRDMWSYHAVAAVVRGYSLLASLPEVKKEQIGATGISWGGYLTCILAGIDERLKVAVPVYGCGFLGDNSAWLGRFAKMAPDQKKLWLDQFDPSKYLPGATCPMLFVNGTNDFAYPLDSYQKSYKLPQGPVTLCIRIKMPHGHSSGWLPEEIGAFVDSVILQKPPLGKMGPTLVVEGSASATFNGPSPAAKAELCYAVDRGPWQNREWKSVEATIGRGTVQAKVPHARPLVLYLNVTDERGLLVSSRHVTLLK
ncbi:MAG: acetylxylan esterase [Pirellulales bacterium]